MSEKVLRVQMLGGFAMYYEDEAIALNKVGRSKSLRLFQMLLLSLPGGISKSEIMDNLYGWNENGDMANRNKNLNNLIYRLKGQLIALGLPEQEYVEIKESKCYFKSDISLKLDTLEFQEAIKQAKECRGVNRILSLWRANEIYFGELLPANSSDMWFFQKSNYFKELYIWSVKELERELEKNKDYKNRLLLYKRAASLYPFENWQLKLMRCNLEMYRYDEALAVYNETVELYAREMGGDMPVKEMQECFEALELMEESHKRNINDDNGWKNMDKIFRMKRNDIEHAIFEKENVKGAYYCTYPSFVDYCRLVVRAKERNEFSAVLMFLTLSHKKTQKKMDLQEQMQLLKEVIGDSLRIGDAFTRYGNRHFILMLVKTELEFCSAVFQRIEATYVKRTGKGELWYYADMTQELNRSSI